MADELKVDPVGIREYISRLAGVAQVANGIEGFLRGDNNQFQSTYLSLDELGNHKPFLIAWNELCDARTAEGVDLGRLLWDNKERLVTALEGYTGTDEEIAATFPPTVDPITKTAKFSLETIAEDNGLDVHSTVDDHHNIPEE